MWRDTFPFSGEVYAFRGRKGGQIKLIWHDGVGMCLFINHLHSYYVPFVFS
jgi:transposase